MKINLYVKKYDFLRFFCCFLSFELLPEYSDLVNTVDCIGMISLRSIRSNLNYARSLWRIVKFLYTLHDCRLPSLTDTNWINSSFFLQNSKHGSGVWLAIVTLRSLFTMILGHASYKLLFLVMHHKTSDYWSSITLILGYWSKKIFFSWSCIIETLIPGHSSRKLFLS